MTSNQEINREVSIKCTSVTVEDRNYTRDKLINGRNTQNGPILFSLKKIVFFNFILKNDRFVQAFIWILNGNGWEMNLI